MQCGGEAAGGHLARPMQKQCPEARAPAARQGEVSNGMGQLLDR